MDMSILQMIIEHCDRRTAEAMSHLPQNMALDPLLKDATVTNVLDMGAQVWNSEFAQIKGALASLGAQIPEMAKTGAPTTPPVLPIPPVLGGVVSAIAGAVAPPTVAKP